MRPLLALCLFVSTSPLAAATWTVDTTADDPAATCDGPCSLRGAVARAAAGDRIEFATSLPRPATITLQHGEIAVGRSLGIDGPGANLLTISGGNQSRIFSIQGTDASADVVLRGLRFANGTHVVPSQGDVPPQAEGGALRIGFGDRVRIERCEFDNNGAYGAFGVAADTQADGHGGAGGDGGIALGGAIANHGWLHVERSFFIGNFATGGLGGRGGNGRGVSAAGQDGGHGGDGGRGGAAHGGAIHSDGTLTVLNTSFFANRATSASGGNGGTGGASGSGLPGDGGDGGANGDATAAALHIVAGTADIDFSTFHQGVLNAWPSSTGGAAGGLGARAGANGAPGTLGGTLFSLLGTTRLNGSLVNDGDPARPICDGARNLPIAIGENQMSDASCGAGFPVDTALNGKIIGYIDGGEGTRILAIDGLSSLVDALGDCTRIDGSVLAVDGRGGRRPVVTRTAATPCDLGALEYNLIDLFRDGFER